MIKHVEHLGLAVADLKKAEALFENLLARKAYKQETVEREGVTTLFFEVGTTKLELLEATQAESPIGKFIAKRGEGLHHIAFEVDDIVAEMERLSALGFTLLSAEPKPGADNKIIVFIHPKDTHGMLVELCQEVV